MKQLSEKQQQIYEFILSYTDEHGYSPSVRDIAAASGLKSTSTVHFHLKALEDAGYVSHSVGKTRSLIVRRPNVPEEEAPQPNRIPVLGNVAAGAPILAEQCIEDYITFDTDGASGEHFALRIRGESMIEAGIMPGDLVVVQRQQVARNGEIVIALIEDEATCKRYERRDGHLWLMPENKDYSPINGDHAQILGKVTAVVRRY